MPKPMEIKFINTTYEDYISLKIDIDGKTIFCIDEMNPENNTGCYVIKDIILAAYEAGVEGRTLVTEDIIT